jgi:activator of 2-hydroxyglutaryl-CoA dehydratase
MAEHSNLNVIVATDCGSTTTKAIMIEKKPEGYRQTFRGEAPTTVEAPFEDVTRGVLNAMQELEGWRATSWMATGSSRPRGDEGVDL